MGTAMEEKRAGEGREIRDRDEAEMEMRWR